MIGYVTLGTNDLARATSFYDQLFAAMGGKRVWETERGLGWGASLQAPSLGVMKPFDGRGRVRPLVKTTSAGAPACRRLRSG
jgi:catechol 2,3-dioxygenase-like lactoylglutathione lyase family enzyme